MINKKYFIYAAAVIMATSSCKKELDKQPTDTFSDANAFITLNDVQLGTNGAYGRYGAYLNNIYASALTSDEAKIGSGNGGQGNLTYRYQYSSDATTGGDVTAGWGAYYSMIDQINRVLPNVATVTATASEEPRRGILRGQLLALRGIAHFCLLQMYSKNYNASDPLGVPALTVSDPLAKPSRNTQGEVMTRIETDLADAKLLLPAVTVATFSDTVMNRINIAAFQARIALYKGDYAASVTFSSEVISSLVKPLSSGSTFADIWTDVNNAETLFRIRYATSTALGALWTTTGGQVYIAPSDKLVAAFASNDIRKNVYIGSIAPGDNYVKKYLGSSRGGRVVDMKAVRIAEMYLIRAEAYAKQASPNIALGAADLNLLRANRITGYTDETFATATDLVAAVLQERFKELAFEGFRFFDLKRNNLPVSRLASDANTAWQNLPSTSPLFVYPIPASEILANSNVIQNPGY
ncbi:MAG TPA: RagB/SusD family nutrient uptake outer membrane protein [Ferruginibacter sp.]|nr:RagB/SusD family nutrient uptake outer membrane protein [Ferruginibacter sp.]